MYPKLDTGPTVLPEPGQVSPITEAAVLRIA
jgi:hypothetical protein